ncbi:trimeric intracellular cation channel family protein [Corynebacterium nuruki]|nr:TRIC cation channel family protein [Corynebacterium nuruki]
MDFVDPSVRTVYATLDLIGVVLYGMIGATIARARNFDIVGIVFLAIITALGGGMIRDVLIDNGPPAALQDMRYFGLALLGALLATAIHMNSRSWEIFRVHGDAVVLGVWAATGSTKALANGLPWSSALFLGVLTVVGGGMIRDVLTGSVPEVFGGATLYATPAALTAALMVAVYSVNESGVAGDFPLLFVGMIVAPVLGAGMMILSYWRGWKLPGTQDLSWAAQAKLRQPMTLARDMARRRFRMRRREEREARKAERAAARRGLRDRFGRTSGPRDGTDSE